MWCTFLSFSSKTPMGRPPPFLPFFGRYNRRPPFFQRNLSSPLFPSSSRMWVPLLSAKSGTPSFFSWLSCRDFLRLFHLLTLSPFFFPWASTIRESSLPDLVPTLASPLPLFFLRVILFFSFSMSKPFLTENWCFVFFPFRTTSFPLFLKRGD